MLDIFDLPDNGENTQIFTSNGITTWQTWIKPRGVKFVNIFVLGGGGGGGSGFSSTGGPCGGGGGGGGAPSSQSIFLAETIPDLLYIRVGTGGAGGIPGGASAGAGNQTNVYINSVFVVQNNLITAPAGAAGSAGSALLAGGAAGGAAGASSESNAPAAFLGTSMYNTGTAGGAGGFSATSFGTSIVPIKIFSCGGGGGGGLSLSGSVQAGSGGTIVGGDWYPTLSGGSSGTTSLNGADGINAVFSFSTSVGSNIFVNTGGGGGGACTTLPTGTGGNGGRGGYGCGGGGGGAAYGVAGRGGAGGAGGDGVVVITAW